VLAMHTMKRRKIKEEVKKKISLFVLLILLLLLIYALKIEEWHWPIR
jgi:hypothetical protein